MSWHSSAKTKSPTVRNATAPYGTYHSHICTVYRAITFKYMNPATWPIRAIRASGKVKNEKKDNYYSNRDNF